MAPVGGDRGAVKLEDKLRSKYERSTHLAKPRPAVLKHQWRTDSHCKWWCNTIPDGWFLR